VADLEDETEVVAIRRDVADRAYSRLVTVSDGPAGMPLWTMGFDFFFFFPDVDMAVLGKGTTSSHVRYAPTYTYSHIGHMHSIRNDAR